MLAVGFNDSLGCWIVKNSWGTGWGDGGFGLIGYGQCGIDSTKDPPRNNRIAAV
jgi:C1A family cysteine protease